MVTGVDVVANGLPVDLRVRNHGDPDTVHVAQGYARVAGEAAALVAIAGCRSPVSATGVSRDGSLKGRVWQAVL